MAIGTDLTIEDFERLPAALARNHELIDGQLVDVSGNTFAHNMLRTYLASRLMVFAEPKGLGKIISEQEFDFSGNAHGPDVAFISTSKLPLINRKLRVQRFVPDLAIEIVSENDKFAALLKKVNRYRSCGVPEAWILSQETSEAFVFSANRRVVLTSSHAFEPEPIPGFSIPLQTLFAEDL